MLNSFGNEIKRKTISVNFPLTYNGIKYYQTDWNLLGLRVKNENLNLPITQYPLVSFFNKSDKLWISWVSSNQNFSEGFTILINSLQGYCSIYNKFGFFLGNLELHEQLNFNLPFTLVDVICSTGLQIKRDPGIPLIYLGFGFLIFSTLFSYITYSQIWIVQDQKKFLIGGNTTRAVLDFELEFLKLIR